MKIIREKLSPTRVKMTISATPAELENAKRSVLENLAKTTKIPGFRTGKAPVSLVERHVDQARLHWEVLDQVVNVLYEGALTQKSIRAVGKPEVMVTKFVPYDELEFTVTSDEIGSIVLPDYKKIRILQERVNISVKDVSAVIQDLVLRMSARTPVERGAQNGDEIVIDFNGIDAKTDEPIKGADGKNYSLVVGSKAFIPGFEDNLIGLKSSDKKQFTLIFPADYAITALRNREVKFVVTVQQVNELLRPDVNDAFAQKVGPFQSVAELRKDIKLRLEAERIEEANRAYRNKVLEQIANATKVDIPDSLIESEVHQEEQQLRQNAAYRGQTWQEYLESIGESEATIRDRLHQPAELRVKSGLALSAIGEAEHINVMPEEYQARVQKIKAQYSDPAMLQELEKPDAARNIMSHILAEKTMDRITTYTTPKPSKQSRHAKKAS